MTRADTTDALVERLRKYATAGRIGGIDLFTIGEMFTQSADTIAAQAARIEALEGALRRVRENYIDPFAVPDELLTEIDSALGASR